MNFASHNSGKRSNAYSESKFTNWRDYDPFWCEALAAHKRFDRKIAENPARPSIHMLRPHPEFIHPCRRQEIRHVLDSLPGEQTEGLRAVIVLAGTFKQLRCWQGDLRCYGWYWRHSRCIYLHAHPFRLGRFGNLDALRDFYLKDVLVHEVGHHVDRFRQASTKTREGFAEWFAINAARK